QRLLVTALACTGPDGWTREGLAVFERADAGWQGISVLPPPPGLGLVESGSWAVDAEGAVVVSWTRPVGAGAVEPLPARYRWTGTALACTGPDGWTREGLAIFERAGAGWQGISVLTPPDGYARRAVGDWRRLPLRGGRAGRDLGAGR